MINHNTAKLILQNNICTNEFDNEPTVANMNRSIGQFFVQHAVLVSVRIIHVKKPVRVPLAIFAYLRIEIKRVLFAILVGRANRKFILFTNSFIIRGWRDTVDPNLKRICGIVSVRIQLDALEIFGNNLVDDYLVRPIG